MRVINLPEQLAQPQIELLSRIRIVAKANEEILRNSTVSDPITYDRLMKRYPDTPSAMIGDLTGLHDDLVAYMPKRDEERLSAKVNARIGGEFKFYRVRADGERHDYTVPQTFIEDVSAAHRALEPNGGAFRRRGVQIVAEGMDATTHFPSWKECSALLESLALCISQTIHDLPTVAAMTAYAGIIHAHPFTDGNGRVARAMYNNVLLSAGIRHFVPISLVASLTGGSFVLKIRRALLGGDWDGLQRFFLDAAKISERWQADAEPFT